MVVPPKLNPVSSDCQRGFLIQESPESLRALKNLFAFSNALTYIVNMKNNNLKVTLQKQFRNTYFVRYILHLIGCFLRV